LSIYLPHIRQIIAKGDIAFFSPASYVNKKSLYRFIYNFVRIKMKKVGRRFIYPSSQFFRYILSLQTDNYDFLLVFAKNPVISFLTLSL